MENTFLELEQKCRNGFTKYELNLLLDENTPQIGKSGYFGDYFLITYHAKQAIVFVDDYDAKVHLMTPFYNAISRNGDYVRLSIEGAVLSTEFFEELENCKAMSETDILNKWIKQNRLVVGGVGFVYRGGRTNIIPKDKAIEMFTKYQRDKCYCEIDWIIFNGEIALSLREYTETDMM